MTEASPDITRLLKEWSNGKKDALDQITPLVYDQLHRIAASHLRRDRREHTLQPTALIHEAYVRMVQQDLPDWQSRTHFFGIAANLMRQILVDYARKHQAAKRGGQQKRVTMEDAFAFSQSKLDDLLVLDEALSALAAFDARKCRVIELRFFGGLSVEETAEALGISVPTVTRDQRMAEAWLKQKLSGR